MAREKVTINFSKIMCFKHWPVMIHSGIILALLSQGWGLSPAIDVATFTGIQKIQNKKFL
jgi:hypothetical protein